MNHRLSNFGVNKAGNPVADCAVCGPRVKVLRDEMHKKGVCWQGWDEKGRQQAAERRERVRTAKTRVTDRKRASRALKTAKKKGAERLTYLWRWVCFERAGRCCQICGKGPFEQGDFQLQAHHIVKRSQSKRLQLDPFNSAALCAGCHMAADRDPIRTLAVLDEWWIKAPPKAVGGSSGFFWSGLPRVSTYLLKERRKTEQRNAEEIEERLLAEARKYEWTEETL